MGWLGAIPIGALGVLMTSYLVRRAWTEALHSTLIAATAVLPLAALLFLPILIGMKDLYPAATNPASAAALQGRLSCAVVLHGAFGGLFWAAVVGSGLAAHLMGRH